MFQIAASYALAKRNNDTAVFDLDSCHTPYQGKPAANYKDTIYKTIKRGIVQGDNIYKDSENILDVTCYRDIPYSDNLILEGGFQSEKYFTDCIDDIKALFSLSDEIWREDDDPSITAVCVRRGDYLKLTDIYEQLSEQYYKNAMEEIGNDTAFVFVSDDIDWCKETFQASNIYYCPLTNDIDQMSFISVCRNVILANSTFGWWGAWLGENENSKIITPKKWFTDKSGYCNMDICPDRWIKL